MQKSVLGLLLGAAIIATPSAHAATSASLAQVLDLVNAARAEKGCGPLVINEHLNAAAERESRAMVTKAFFNHTEPDGTTPGMRVHATGYAFQMIGENIEADSDTEAATAFTNWMNSPGHRDNILTCAFKETGLALVEQTDDRQVDGVPEGDRYFWTQVFAMPVRTQDGR